MKADHFARVEKSEWIVFVFGFELDVVGTVTTSVFDVVYMRIGDEYADFAAVGNQFVHVLFACVIDQGDGAGYGEALRVAHEFDVEEDLASVASSQELELLHAFGGGEACLDVSPLRVCFDGPKGGVIPGVVAEEGLGSWSDVWAGESNFPLNRFCRCGETFQLGCLNHD